MKYQLIVNSMGNTTLSVDIEEMIYINEAFNPLSYLYLSENSYQKIRLKPFPMSSMIMSESRLNEQKLSLYFLTRDMHFMTYNLTGYTEQG